MQHPRPYSALLRDPRWQRKRLEIMQRDEFSCTSCGNTEETLNVHHCYYGAGKKPWEYEDASLVTLCEKCHEIETIHGKQAKFHFLNRMSAAGFTAVDFALLADLADYYISNGNLSRYSLRKKCHDLLASGEIKING